MATFNDGSGNALYVGGTFVEADGRTVNQIARWNGVAWSEVGGGVSGVGLGSSPSVNSFLVYDNGTGPALLAGGAFSKAGDFQPQFFGYPNLARWDGRSWSSLAGAADPDVAVSGRVNALAVLPGGPEAGLYVGGSIGGAIDRDGNIQVKDVARWNAGVWSPVGGGLDSPANRLAEFDDGTGPALYVTGVFRHASVHEANHIAKWDGTKFSPLGTGLQAGAMFSQAEGKALRAFDDGSGPALFVGGRFDIAGGEPSTNIAKWTGRAWQPVGAGLTGFGGGSVNALRDWEEGGRPSLIAGGQFTSAGAERVLNVARWDGANWFAMGQGLSGTVNVFEVFDDGSGPALYVGGNISQAAPAGPFIRNVAKWNGVDWVPLGSPSDALNGDVFAMTVHDDGRGPALFVGGQFSQSSGGVRLGAIAKWTGQEWQALGAGLDGFGFAAVHALRSFDDGTGSSLYLGGGFSLLSPFNIFNIAQWDGTAFQALGKNLSSSQTTGVRDLIVFDDGSGPALFAAGYISGSGNLTTQNMAKWYRPTAPCPPPRD
jgi:hypothetical protein